MRIAVAAVIIAGLIVPVRAQYEPDILAGTHRVQFENEWVRVVRVRYEAGGGIDYRTRPVRRAVTEGQDVNRVEFTNKQMQITRIIIQPGHSADVETTATEPATLVTVAGAQLKVGGDTASEINLVPGQERWVAEKRREMISNVGRAPVELIRVDFLTRPAK